MNRLRAQLSRRVAPLLLLLMLMMTTMAAPARGDESWTRIYLRTHGWEAFHAGRYGEAEKFFRALIKLDPGEPVALIHLAAIAKQKGDRARAITWLERLAAAHPENYDGRHELGALLLAAGDAQRAAVQLEAAVALRPSSADALVHWGNALLQLGRRGEAIRAYERALEADPGFAWAHRQLGSALVAANQLAPAKQHLTAALAAYGQDPDLFLDLGHVERLLGDAQAALADYERAAALAPGRADAHRFAGLSLEALGRDDAARKKYQLAMTLAPRDPIARVLGGNLERRTRHAAAAEKLYRAALKIAPGQPWALQSLGYLLIDGKRFAEARVVLTRALAIAPRDASLVTTVGDMHAELGNLAAAERFYRRAVGLDGRLVDAQIKLGDMLFRQQRADEALTQYRRAVAIAPDDARAHVALGDCLRRFGDVKAARREYERAVELAPKLAWARRQLGYALFELGEYKEASELLAGVTETFAGEIDLQLTLGHLARLAGKSGEAWRRYDEAIRLGPKDPRGYYFRAELSRVGSDYVRAIADLERALALDPKYVDGWVLLGDIYATRADAARADEAYGHALALQPDAAWPKRQLGFLYFYHLPDRRAEAARLLAEARASFPADDEIPLVLGHLAKAAGKLDEARRLYAEAAEAAPSALRPKVFLAVALRELGDLREALAVGGSAVAIDARSGWAWLELGQTQLLAREPKLALASAEKAVAFAPTREALLFVGKMRFRFGMVEPAIVAYRRARDLDPAHAQSHLALASALLERARRTKLAPPAEAATMNEAAREVDAALAQLDEDPFTHLVAGHIYVRLRKLAEVEHHFARAVALAPDDLRTKVSALRGLYDARLIPSAEKALATIGRGGHLCPDSEWDVDRTPQPAKVEAEPADTLAHASAVEEAELYASAERVRGAIASLHGDHPAARQAYACAISLDPGHPQDQTWLGEIYEREGQLQFAEYHYLNALVIDPSFAPARSAIDRLEKEYGYPIGPVQASAEIQYRSEIVPTEMLARQALFITPGHGDDGRRLLLTVPRTLDVDAVVGHRFDGTRSAPRLELRYDFLDAQSSFLSDQLVFEDTIGHQASVRLRGRLRAHLIKPSQLDYEVQYRFSYISSSLRTELHHLALLGGRWSMIGLATAEASIGFEHVDFNYGAKPPPSPNPIIVPPTGDDRAADSLLLNVRLLPLFRPSVEAGLGYSAQSWWMTPSARTLWDHQVSAFATFRARGFFVGGQLRLGTGTDAQRDPSVPTPVLFAYAVGPRGGYRFGDRATVFAQASYDGVAEDAKFNALRIGAGASYRFYLVPALRRIQRGFLLSAEYQVRDAYALGKIDHLVWAGISFAR